jgi:type-F conjugative transfer system pilin assembly protein TrbC
MEKNKLLCALALRTLVLRTLVLYILMLFFSVNCFANTAQIVVFISSSLPKKVIENYVTEAKKYKAVLVMRGLKEDSFIKTKDFVINSGKDAGVQINEDAFSLYNIKYVPTIVLAKEIDYGDSSNCDVVYDKVEGNITITGALRLFEKDGDLKKDAEEKLEK